jgi:hypothetical protein
MLVHGFSLKWMQHVYDSTGNAVCGYGAARLAFCTKCFLVRAPVNYDDVFSCSRKPTFRRNMLRTLHMLCKKCPSDCILLGILNYDLQIDIEVSEKHAASFFRAKLYSSAIFLQE